MSEDQFDLDNVSTCKAVLKDSVRITPSDTDEVRHLVLSIDEPSFRFREGQTIGVLVPGPHAFGNRYHHRRYSIANAPDATAADDSLELSLLVRRCFYVDEVNGERYPGVASNYLCDAKPGDCITLTGPYRSLFHVPDDPTSNLLMIGTGTGIAPFRGFAQRIYDRFGHWEGKVRLFYGARTGMELYYQNDINGDLANYYDQATFKAFQAISDRPLVGAEAALERGLAENLAEAWELIQQPNTYVFLSGLTNVADALERAMIQQTGSSEAWRELRQRLVSQGRWAELLYS